MNTRNIHSLEYIDDSRYEWWNRDYLEVLLRRVGIDHVGVIADIGIGAAHWTALIGPYAKRLTRVIGVDIEEHWLAKAHETLAAALPQVLTTLSKGDVHNLPVDDDVADLVTCQTLLMHCSSPERAVNEMVRITRPGGWLLLVEPVNLLNRAQLFDAIAFLDPADQVKLLELWSEYHLALKESSGMDRDIAASLPRLLIGSGIEQVNVFANDRMMIRVGTEAAPDLGSEYLKEDVIRLLSTKGVSIEKIEQVRLLADKLRRAIDAAGYSVSPLNMFATIGRKPVN